jgi:hypothetical protein
MIAIGIGIVVVGLAGWIPFLAITLPDRYVARQWNLVWVGFDFALAIVLGYAAWTAWFHRRVMIVTALVAGTLLASDAWFDAITSLGNRHPWLNIVTAIVEVPASAFFFWLARRILLQAVGTVHQLSGAPGPPPRLRAAHALHVTEAEPASDDAEHEHPATHGARST